MPIATIVEAMLAAENALERKIKIERELLSDIAKARAQVSRGTQPTTALRKLEGAFKQIADAALPEEVRKLNTLCGELSSSIMALKSESAKNDLRAIAEKLSWNFKPLGDDFVFGPFVLKLDPKTETARLQFAKTDAGAKLPLDPGLIERTAIQFAESVLRPVDESAASALGTEMEEAIRVALARQKLPPAFGDLRAELPAVYREMASIRQYGNRTGRVSTGEDYPLGRFVVELKGLVGSDFNTSQTRRFKLEPAVIENTRNPKKSIYLPQRLDDGGGEGTYYQAIVFPCPNLARSLEWFCMTSLDKREAQAIIHSLGTSGQPPKLGASRINVGTERVLSSLKNDYLEGICLALDGVDGQGICKWVEGDYGNGKTQFLRCFQELTWSHDYVTAFVELSQDECPLDRADRVFASVARTVQARPLSAADVDRSKGLDVAIAQLFDRKFDRVLTGMPSEEARRAAAAWISTTLRSIAVESPSLCTAAEVHLLALLNGEEEKRVLSGLFLRGEPVSTPELKTIGIYEKLDRANGFRLLRSMCQLLQRSELAAGTAILFDEARRTLSLMSNRAQKLACENLLTVINKCNSGDLPGTVFLYAVMPEFFTNFAVQYPALQQRCGPTTRIKLNSIGGLSEMELLQRIGQRIRDIFQTGFAYEVENALLFQDNLRALATAAIRQTGGDGTRRLFVKSCVEMLKLSRDQGISALDEETAMALINGSHETLVQTETAEVEAGGE